MNCDRVSKIEALTSEAEDRRGTALASVASTSWCRPTSPFPTSQIPISEAYADDWYQVARDFVILGRCDEVWRGTLYLAPDTGQRLFT